MPVAPPPASPRIQSIDVLRGAVMILMAIDHVRVYSGLPAAGTEPGIFFTRWITHFCAPAFVFFAGAAALLHGKKLADARALARYLVTRGLLLVVLELTLIRFFWTFNLNYSEFVLAGVIWMIGWCMVLMAFFVRLQPGTVGVIGLVIIFAQQVFAFVPRVIPDSLQSSLGGFWEFIYSSGGHSWPWINVLYVIVPWIGVMMAGYGFGTILTMEAERRNRICVRVGWSAIALFLIVGSLMILLKPAPPEAPPFIFRLLNQQKYPASQLYLLMTLGPMIALVPLAERAKGWIADVFSVFGRVPFFYYLIHIPLIHLSALLVNMLLTGQTHQEWYATAPFVWVEDVTARWSLWMLYLVFVVDVGILYVKCRWYVGYKGANPEKKWVKFV